MPRRISFALTLPQLLDGSKTVTRRLGWVNKQGTPVIKAGDVLTAIDKHHYRAKGGSRVLGTCHVLDVRREPLDAITAEDCAREGFPKYSPDDFVYMFCEHMTRGTRHDTLVTRIEFRFEPA